VNQNREGKGMSDEKNKLYFYSFSFVGGTPDGTGGGYASTSAGYELKPSFTIREIDKRKLIAGLTYEAVLLSITFLGVMTEEEFKS
jgi:hypothetical protein